MVVFLAASMLSSTPLSELRNLRGSQVPRVGCWPDGDSPIGDFAVKWCRAVGFTLDPWQELILRDSLHRDDSNLWRTPHVGVVVPRQSGKSELLVARQMFGLFMLPDEKLIMSSAHLFDTARESFQKMLARIDDNIELRSRVARVDTAHGKEGIELKDGSRIRFKSRSSGSTRGFSVDLVMADEAYDLTDDEMAAIVPTMSARPNAQLWFASSAGMVDSHVLERVRKRGFNKDPRLAYFEWSAPDDADLDDPAAVALANPGLGIRLSYQSFLDEREALSEEQFKRERLGIWAKVGGDYVIDPELWESLTVDRPYASVEAFPSIALAVDVPPSRDSASIGLASWMPDGRPYVELVDRRDGVSWVPGALRDLKDRLGPRAIGIDEGAPAGGLVEVLRREARVRHAPITLRKYAAACGRFYDLVQSEQLAHFDNKDLSLAIEGARKTKRGETAWTWSRKESTVDISPLVAVTLAVSLLGAAPSGEQKSSSGSKRRVVVMN